MTYPGSYIGYLWKAVCDPVFMYDMANVPISKSNIKKLNIK